MDIYAITLGPLIICKEKLPHRSLRHEMIHYHQYKEILDSFRIKYDNLLKEKYKLKIMYDTNVKLHEATVKKYKWIIGTSSKIFVGTFIF